MPILDRLFELVASFGGFLAATPEYRALRFAIAFIGLLLSLVFLGYWFYLEGRYRFGRGDWKVYLAFWAESRLKSDVFAKEWQRLQKLLPDQRLRVAIEAEALFQEVLNLYFYNEEPLLTRLPKVTTTLIPNRDRLILASEAIDRLRAKERAGERVDLAEPQVLSLLREFELALLALLVITEADAWVTIRKPNANGPVAATAQPVRA